MANRHGSESNYIKSQVSIYALLIHIQLRMLVQYFNSDSYEFMFEVFLLVSADSVGPSGPVTSSLGCHGSVWMTSSGEGLGDWKI